MIKIEIKDGKAITYSDSGFMIQKLNTNEVYESAEDVLVNGKPKFEYIETDIKIEE